MTQTLTPTPPPTPTPTPTPTVSTTPKSRPQTTGPERSSRLSFQPTLKLVREDGATQTVRPGGALAPVLYLVARRHCNFSRIRLAAANKSGLEAARLKARQQQRFANTRMRIEQDSSDPRDAGLWAWSGTLKIDPDTPVATRRCLPESLAREPMDEGSRLVQCDDGVEGEIWQDGVLTASRWWPQTPAPREWQLFLRAGKQLASGATSETPAPEHVAWRSDLPLLDRDPDNLAISFAPPKIAGLAAGVLGLLLAFQLGAAATYSVRIQHGQQRLAEAVQENREGYRLRAAALGNQSRIETARGLDNPALILHVVNAITQSITEDVGDIVSININDTGIEVLTRVDEAPDFTALASALETSPYLEDVFLESTNDAFFTTKAKVPEAAGRLDLYREENLDAGRASEGPQEPAIVPSDAPSDASLNVSSDARRANGAETGGDNG
ncbi:MAG: hypothetical protein AAFR69_03025 [Pseudomonadota bacterium]